MDQIAAKMLADGVTIQAWVSHFVVAPPLIVTKEEIELGINTLDKWLHLADEGCVSAVVPESTAVTSDS